MDIRTQRVSLNPCAKYLEVSEAMGNEINFGMSGGCVGEMPKGPVVERSGVGNIMSDVNYVSSLKAEIQELKADKLRLESQLENSECNHKKDVVELNEVIKHLENQLKSTKVCSCNEVTSLEKEAYLELERVLRMAYDQAASGKGKDRHANGKPFVDQPILSITRMVGDGYPLGQAMKKAQETQRLPTNKAKIAELLGAINYLAAAIIYYEEQSSSI